MLSFATAALAEHTPSSNTFARVGAFVRPTPADLRAAIGLDLASVQVPVRFDVHSRCDQWILAASEEPARLPEESDVLAVMAAAGASEQMQTQMRDALAVASSGSANAMQGRQEVIALMRETQELVGSGGPGS